jgi:hypothetical protein
MGDETLKSDRKILLSLDSHPQNDPRKNLSSTLHRTLLLLSIFCLCACSAGPKTFFIKRKYTDPIQSMRAGYTPYNPDDSTACICISQLQVLFTQIKEVGSLNRKEINDGVAEAVCAQKLECSGESQTCTELTTKPQLSGESSTEWQGGIPPTIAELQKRIEDDNSGLFCPGNSGNCHSFRLFHPRVTWPGVDSLKKSLDSELTVAAAVPGEHDQPKPALLAMSVRQLSVPSKPGPFASLPERAQAATIHFAESSRPPAAQSKPADPLELLNQLTPDDPKFSPTQKVELTISNAVNSGSANDRVQYLAAYLSVTPLPAESNGTVSLEGEVLRQFKQLYLGHQHQEDRKRFLYDLNSALESLKVRVVAVDQLDTKDVSIALGTLARTAAFTGSAGTPSTFPASASGQASYTAARTENLAIDIDKRSTWINKDRTLLRVTQRGIQEANIAGSIATAITLQIPVTDFYVIDMTTEKDKQQQESITFKPKNITQPVFSSVDAIGVMVASVRVSMPGWFWGDFFRKEPNGVAYTQIEKEYPVHLWQNDRTTWSLFYRDLAADRSANVSEKDSQIGVYQPGVYQPLGMRFTGPPYASGEAIFADRDAWVSFLKAFAESKLGLVKGKPDAESRVWYQVVQCHKKGNKVSLSPTTLLLGTTDEDGRPKGFSNDANLDVNTCNKGLAESESYINSPPSETNQRHQLPFNAQ